MQAVEQVAGAADDQLQAARWQQAGLVHQAHHGFRQVAGGTGWFYDARHTREEARGELFQHAPDREVEGVDVHRHATARHQDMSAGEGAHFAQLHGRAFVDDVARRQFTGAEAGVGEQRAVAAFDVDPAVGAGCAAVMGNRVELFLALAQVQGQSLETLGALLEIQRHQAADTLATAVLDGFGEVRALFMGAGDFMAVDGAAQDLRAVLADPATGDETLQGRGVRHQDCSGYGQCLARLRPRRSRGKSVLAGTRGADAGHRADELRQVTAAFKGCTG
ncbi:hypothetical protein D3C86_1469300 [compost metagenome]